MSEARDCAPLTVGARVGAWRIVGLIEQQPYVCRYLADDGRRRAVVQELLPRAQTWRDGDAVQVRDADDRNTLRWWLRNYLDKANALAGLALPGFARVFDAFEANGTGYAALEHHAGSTLAERVRTRGALDWRDYLPALRSLLEALAAAHAQNLVLRDITPMQLVFGSGGRVLLSGFGPLRGPVRFRAQTVSCTAPSAYAAAEELSVGGAVGPWTDVHGLAASSAFALLGRTPPDAARRAAAPLRFELAPPLPAAMCALLEASLTAEGEARPAIGSWLRTLPAPASTPVPDPARSAPRAVPRLALAGGALLVLAALGVWLGQRSPARPASDAPSPVAPGAPVPDAPMDAPSAETRADMPQAAPATEVATAPAAEPAVAEAAPAAMPAPAPAMPRVMPRAGPAAPPPALATAPSAASGASTATRAPAPAAASGADPRVGASLTPPTAPPDPAERDAAGRQRLAAAHAAQLEREKAQCKTHLSELLGGRPLTYADLAAMKGVERHGNGNLYLSRVATDDGRKASLVIDPRGCVVTVRVN